MKNLSSESSDKENKGKKRIRGVPANKYGEAKNRTTVSLTATALEKLEELRIEHNCKDRCNLLEQIGHKEILLYRPDSREAIEAVSEQKALKIDGFSIN